MRSVGRWLVALCSLLLCEGHAYGQATDGMSAAVATLQAAVAAGDSTAFRTLLLPTLEAERADAMTAAVILPGTTRAVVRERDRQRVPDVAPESAFRSVVEIFTERGDLGRILTLRIDFRRIESGGGATRFVIADQERLTEVDGLYRLRLDARRQFDVRNLTIRAEDLVLTVPKGSAFTADVDYGITALVVLGQGRMTFAPRPEAEKGQVRLFSGQDSLETSFSSLFVRLNPGELEDHVEMNALKPTVSVDPREARRAQELFDQHVNSSFALGLNDLSQESWSLVPSYGDFLAEIRTRRFSTLTYAKSMKEAEDITLFNRRDRKNIAVYTSVAQEQRRGRDYHEDELADYDVLDYDIDIGFAPERQWIDGNVAMRVRILAPATATLTLHLAESLTVKSVRSNLHGRLLTIRVKDQNSILLSLPAPVVRDDVLTLSVDYAGPLESVQPDREALALAGQATYIAPDAPVIEPEPRWVYSNRSYWYPQGQVTDFATGVIRITVPDQFQCVASGDPASTNPIQIAASQPGLPPLKKYTFTAGQPLRYFAWVASRFLPAGTVQVGVPRYPATSKEPSSAVEQPNNGHGQSLAQEPPRARTGVYYDLLDVAVVGNPRQVGRGRTLLPQIADMFEVYTGILGDSPFPSFTLTAIDSDLPGGHSPGYFALLNQPLPTTPYLWRNDPVYFDTFPQFFLAHEVAHQFWGQAVGWKNYHEQWLSEGFAQYFAALFAERRQGRAVLLDILRQMRRSALDRTNQGPIWLGYRVGHIRSDSRAFRAVVYNKSAMVLHMLRRLIGDEAFFRGIRTLYTSERFRKAGTEEVRRTFENASGRPLKRFFEGWVYSATIPTVAWRWAPESGAGRAEGAIRITLEQTGAPFEIPVTVRLTYAAGDTEDVVLVLDGARAEHVVPLRAPLRGVSVNDDNASLARFERR